MALIKDGVFTDDPWTDLGEDEAITDEACVVSLERWQKDADTLRSRNAPLGLRLGPGQSPDAIAGDIDQFSVIKLEFAAFKDGRAYSYARMLRQRYGYTRELRASGDVLRSQLQFMHRVGINAFDVDERITPEILAKELGRLGNVYQPTTDGKKTVLEKRSKH